MQYSETKNISPQTSKKKYMRVQQNSSYKWDRYGKDITKVEKHQEWPIYFSVLFEKHIHCNSVYVCCFLKDKCFSNLCCIKISVLSLNKKLTIPESQAHWKREDRRTGFDDKGKRNVLLAVRAGDGEPALP